MLQFFKGLAGKLAAKGALVKVAAGVGGLAIAGVSVNALFSHDPPPPKKPAPVTCATAGGALIAGGKAIERWSRPAVLGAARGEMVRSCGVSVIDIPADEGFWVGTGPRSAAWVQVMGRGESTVNIDEGDTVTFRGRVVANSPGFVSQLHLAKGADRLRRQGHHIEVREDKIHVASQG